MKTVIEMARGVKATAYTNRHYPDRTTYTFGPEQLEAFAELVRADEREACARIAEEPSATTYECTVACGGPAQTFTQRLPKDAHEIAKQIRARGQA